MTSFLACLIRNHRSHHSYFRHLFSVGRSASTDASLITDRRQLPLTLPIIAIWGSNTGVGKTLFSAALAAACTRAGVPLSYSKPVQTGFPTDSDARLVAAAAGLTATVGPHAAALYSELQDSKKESTLSEVGTAKTLFAWEKPVSPHLAVQLEGRSVSDDEFTAATLQYLQRFAQTIASTITVHTSKLNLPSSTDALGMCLVETAGGVASPGPSGTLQCDLYRMLRLPALLIGDGRLGGISSTLSSYESLISRGYTVPVIALMEPEGLSNYEAIQRHVDRSTLVMNFPPCQPRDPSSSTSEVDLIDPHLAAWLQETESSFDALRNLLEQHHTDRVAYLSTAADVGKQVLWWPFTQHAALEYPNDVTVIESRVGERFNVLVESSLGLATGDEDHNKSNKSREQQQQQQSNRSENSVHAGGLGLEQLYDGCASWWTQGVNEQQQSHLTRAMAHAASRYGHVMFPQNVHQPALDLATKLLSIVGGTWASRVFYSDDGSTAIEVALKMAFRTYLTSHGLLEGDTNSNNGTQLEVIGLEEAYHGDTLGAMDAVAPSVFNGRMQTPWYKGRGVFLAPPMIGIVKGEWTLKPWKYRITAHSQSNNSNNTNTTNTPSREEVELDIGSMRFESLSDVFDVESRIQSSPLIHGYLANIDHMLNNHKHNREFGACIIEPILQGAGGMRFIDPLYQRLLVDYCKHHDIPVIYDEVFSGLWRLGVPSAGKLLGVDPDIACFAKLLTGGMVPLATTLASERVFETFKGDTKAQALLHGHSYTAHPVGCAVACAALDVYTNSESNYNLCCPEVTSEGDNRCRKAAAEFQITTGSSSSIPSTIKHCETSCRELLTLWNEDKAKELSLLPNVASVVPLGTVLAVELESNTTGYASSAAAVVVKKLRQAGVYSRPLGNVVYLMVTPLTQKEQCNALMIILEEAIRS